MKSAFIIISVVLCFTFLSARDLFRTELATNPAVNGTHEVAAYGEVYQSRAHPIPIDPPENLQAVVNGSNVELTWDEPGSGGSGQPGWLSYCGENSNGIGAGAVIDFDVAAKWDASGAINSISPYVGMNITKIKFFPNEINCSYAVRIWSGTANTLVVDQACTPNIGAWNEIVLSTPYTIPEGVQLMAGFRCNAQSGYPAGCDTGPQVDGYGNLIRYQGTWTTLTALSSTFTYNWNIRVYVADAAGREYVLSHLPIENSQSLSSSPLCCSGSPRQTREVTAYRIYRDGALHSMVVGTTLNYMDNNVPGGLHSYYVTAMYATVESNGSNSVTAFVMPPSHVELLHDDGTSEQGYSVGATRQIAVKYMYPGSVAIRWIKVFVHTAGSSGIIVRVFNNDGTNGMPGTQIYQNLYPVASVVTGWNYIPLPQDVVVADGSFYVAILETTLSSHIGLDTSSSGFSYKKVSTVWEPVTEGEIMIRPIIYSTMAGSQSIPLVSGWNLVSLNVSPVDHDISTLFSDISGSLQQIKGTEGVYIAGNPYSTLSSLADGKAYSILMSAPCMWTVLGLPITVNTALPLDDGWNLTAFLPQSTLPVENAMASINGWLQQVKGTDGVFIPDNPYSTLTHMYPGKGYWIKINGAHTLTYPLTRDQDLKLRNSNTPELQRSMTPAVLSSSMSVLARCDAATAGDFLIARVNGELRGREHFIAPEGFAATLIQIYTETSGEEIAFCILKADGREVPLVTTLSSEPHAHQSNYPEFISLQPQSLSGDEPLPTVTALLGCYPNPFINYINIAYKIEKHKMPVAIEIYNLKGQVVKSLVNENHTKGSYQTSWDGRDSQGRQVASGIYYISMNAGDYRKTMKVLLTK